MMEMTQCTAQQAQFMLEASMGDMNRAIAMYYGEAGLSRVLSLYKQQVFQMHPRLACSVPIYYTLRYDAVHSASQNNLLLTVASCAAEESQLAAPPPSRSSPMRVAPTPPRPLAPLPGRHLADGGLVGASISAAGHPS